MNPESHLKCEVPATV